MPLPRFDEPSSRETAVLILADLFRFQHFEGEGAVWIPRRNAQVLQALMEAAVPRRRGESATILDHRALGWSEGTFRATFGVEVSPESWTEFYNGEVPPVLADAIIEMIRDRVVVAFELPTSLWSLACEHASCLLDLAIHPVRFGRELLFYGRSAGLQLASLVTPRQTEASLRWEATSMRSRLCIERGPEPARTDALLALQVGVDRALLGAEGLASPLDHLDAIREIANSHSRLQVKPHPYGSISVELAEALLLIPNMQFTSRNVYELLARSEIRSVWSISSSVVHEAEYFGLDGVALRPDLLFGKPVHRDFYPITLDELLGPVGSALDAIARGREAKADTLRPVVSHEPILRELFGQTWAYGEYSSAPAPLNGLPTERSLFSDPHFDNGRVYGWGPPESWGIWCIGPIGVVNFAWREDYGSSLKVMAEAFIYAGHPSRLKKIEVWSSGILLGEFNVTDVAIGTSPLVFDVPKPLYGDIAQITFFNRQPLSPAEAERSMDTRKLGLGLVSLRTLPNLL